MNKKIDRLFVKFNKNTPGCALVVVQNGKIILEKCYGLADLKSKIPITPNTAFRLASLTKPFTAMAIMILKEKGMLDFDDQLDKFFPDYGKEITIRQLLTHTSGMSDHEQPLYKKIKKGEEPTIYDSLEVLKEQKGTLFKPGGQFAYSDAGYVVLALTIEKVSGKRYADFLTENIFIPLQMRNTVVLDETKPVIQNRAYGYKKSKNKYKLFDYDPLNYIVGDEGIYSTVRDLAKWSQAWSRTILVGSKTLKEALTPQRLSKANQGRCGFSWFIPDGKRKIFFQDGFWVGFNNIMLTDVKNGITVILLSNTQQFSTEQKRTSIAKKILEYRRNW